MSGRGEATALPEDIQSWLQELKESATDSPLLLRWKNDINFGPGDNGGWAPLQAQHNPTFDSLHFGPELTIARDLQKHFG